MPSSPFPDSLGTPDPEQLIRDWRGMADLYEAEEPVAGSIAKRKARIETLRFCADGLSLWLKSVQAQHLALLPHDVLDVIHAAVHLNADDVETLGELIEAAENMKFGAA